MYPCFQVKDKVKGTKDNQQGKVQFSTLSPDYRKGL